MGNDGCTMCETKQQKTVGNTIVGRVAEQSMWVGPMRNLLNLLCQCQTAYSVISSCFEPLETVRCLTGA